MERNQHKGVALAISWNDSKKEKKGKVLALFVASAISLAVISPAMRTSMSQGMHEMVSVIVRALPGGETEAALAVENVNGEVGRSLAIINGFEAQVPRSSISGLVRSDAIYEVTPNGKVQFLQLAPETGYATQEDAAADADMSVPSYGGMAATTKTVGADKYWNNGFTGQGVDVALIDTGVAPVEGLNAARVINGPDLSFESQFPETQYVDTMGHGTHMAGIIAGSDSEALAAEKAAFLSQLEAEKTAFLAQQATEKAAFVAQQAADRAAFVAQQTTERLAFVAQQASEKAAYLANTYQPRRAQCNAMTEPAKTACNVENDAAKAAYVAAQDTARAAYVAAQETAKAVYVASQEPPRTAFLEVQAGKKATFLDAQAAKKAAFLEALAAKVKASFNGVAPGARILNMKVGQADGASDVSQVIAAIDWVVQHKNDNGMNVRVINMSFGTDGVQDYVLDPLTFAVETAWHNGIVVVVAAGNAGFGSPKLNNPAYDPYVIAVTTDDTRGTSSLLDDAIPDWTSRGNENRHPDLAAPGVSIESLRVDGSFIDEEYPLARVGDRYIKGTGTSQSTAVVSGAAALVLSRYPNLNPDQVKAMLEGNSRRLRNADVEAQGAGLISMRRGYLNPPPDAAAADQTFPVATGEGLLQLSRGTGIVADEDGIPLEGEVDIFGMPFDGKSWSLLAAAGKSWSGGVWNGSEWTGGDWSGKSWSGKSWSGKSWSGKSWSGKSWSGKSWSGKSWSGKSWSGKSWSGKSWSGKSWSGMSWSGKSWSGKSWS
jgi:subtilisin family serine protease